MKLLAVENLVVRNLKLKKLEESVLRTLTEAEGDEEKEKDDKEPKKPKGKEEDDKKTGKDKESTGTKPIETELAESLQELMDQTMKRSKTDWDFPATAEEDKAASTKDVTAYKYTVAVTGKRGPLADVICYIKLSAADKKMKLKFDVLSREKLHEPQLQILKKRAEDAVGADNVIVSFDENLHVDIAEQNPLDRKLLGIAAILLAWNKDLPEGTDHDVSTYQFENRNALRQFTKQVARRVLAANS